MFASLNEKIINYIFTTSKEPVLYHDLLAANKAHNEGLRIESVKLGFRLNLTRAYIAFAILSAMLIIPFSVITHPLFKNIDSHFSIVAAIILTAFYFMAFNIFRDRMIDVMSKRRIIKAWSLHFPHFAYEKHHKTVSSLYTHALKTDLPKREMERYILENLID